MSHELHKIMGINDLCISADEIAARIQEMWLSKSAWIALAFCSRVRRHDDR